MSPYWKLKKTAATFGLAAACLLSTGIANAQSEGWSGPGSYRFSCTTARLAQPLAGHLFHC
jgi:hypothetical protein